MRRLLLNIALLGLSQAAWAQQTPPPGATGGQIQQIPLAPIPPRPLPEIRVEEGNAPQLPLSDQTKILVKTLRVTGQTIYSEAELLAVTGFSPGTELTLPDLRALALKIAGYYRKNGYFVAHAYLPQQDIKEGLVTIAVIEGRYGAITLRNQSNLSDALARRLLEGVRSGDTIAIAPLESSLLNLSDMPGVIVKSTLVPGASVGTSDLIVDVTQGRRFSGSVDADNAGNRYTGENRIGATVNFNEPLGLGDVASLRVLTSGTGLNYARASYQLHLGKAMLGVAYTALNYRLGREFAALRAHGTATIASVYGSYPLLRSRSSNLYAQLGYDDKTFQDRVDSTSTVTDKKARVWMASLLGDRRDGFGGGGVTAFSLTWSSGVIDILTPAALAADAAGARSNGQFNKLGFTLTRLQNLTDTTSFYASLSGQAASKNLDISEKMLLGGVYGVRAYPAGEAFGDEGYLLNLELRKTVPKFSENMPGQMQAVAFIDTGTVTINKNPWVAGENRRTLSGAGVGLTWIENNNFVVKAYYARKLGNAVATSAPDRSGRFWIQGIKYF